MDDMPVSALPKDIPSEVASILFASQYDDAVQFFKMAVAQLGLEFEEFDAAMREQADLLNKVMPMPKGLTVGESGPYVEVTDLMCLGWLAYQLYLRRDSLPDLGNVDNDS